MSFLTITPLKPSELPTDEAIIAEGRKFIDSSDTWKQTKKYFGTVSTSYLPARPDLDGAPWYARTSVHKPDEITFDQLWDKLSRDKAVNEKEFVHEIKKVTHVKERSPTSNIVTAYYTFSPPVSPRVFTVLQVVHLDDSNPTRRQGFVVSIPVDLSEDAELAKLEEKGIRGRYVSVERVMELEDGKGIEWRMVTSSTPGGNIPKFLVETTMAKKISADVPQFLKWYKGLPPSTNTTKQA